MRQLDLVSIFSCAVFLTGCGQGDQEGSCLKDDRVQAGTWTDSTTCLMWQEPLFAETKAWADADEACTALELAGYDDWRLPSIDELRSLALGCAATVTGGACGVTDDCLETACSSTVCDGCEELGGPGPDGCYRLASLSGDCMTTWTSSVPPDVSEDAWTVGFGGCHVLHYPRKQNNINTRCVR